MLEVDVEVEAAAVVLGVYFCWNFFHIHQAQDIRPLCVFGEALGQPNQGHNSTTH